MGVSNHALALFRGVPSKVSSRTRTVVEAVVTSERVSSAAQSTGATRYLTFDSLVFEPIAVDLYWRICYLVCISR